MISDNLNQSLAEACIILGLAPPFTADKAKARYRELAKIYHPDVGTLKNGERFGEISRAYDLLENNIARVGKSKIGFVSADNAHGKMGSMLDELHAARTETIKAEATARQMADEAEALRRYYSVTQSTSKRNWIITTLIGTAALVAGITIGVLKSSTPPTKNFEPGYHHKAIVDIRSLTAGILQPTIDATIDFSDVVVNVGTTTAELSTSPTVSLTMEFPPGVYTVPETNANTSMSSPPL